MGKLVRMFRLGLGLALAALSAPAHADMAKFEAALALFNEAALWRDGGLPGGGAMFPMVGAFRYNTGLRVHIGGASTSTLRTVAEQQTRLAAEIAGLGVEFVDSADKANLKFNFFQEYMAPPGIPSAGCVTQTRSTPANPRDVTIHVRMDFSSCTAHELLHAMGFSGHPHNLDTILSYTRRGGDRSFTDLDKLALRALYRSGMPSGAYQLPALVAARAYLAQELGAIPAGGKADDLARPFMDAQLARLRAVNEPYIQAQLGNAYAFGHYVAVDHAEAVRFWQLAAEKKHPDATFRVGVALRTGQGIAADATAARTRLREASELGHNLAPGALGEMLRGGAGGPADAVEAYAYFDLAQRRGQTAAATVRDRLAADFDAATKARAAARASQLPTAPPRPAQ